MPPHRPLGVFIGIVLNPQVPLGRTGIFTILDFSINEHGIISPCRYRKSINRRFDRLYY